MAYSINKVFLLGNLVNDPKVIETSTGDTMVTFSIATSEKWKDKVTGEQKEVAEFTNITVFRGLADICAKYLKKGSQVHVIGKLKTRSWVPDQEKPEEKRYATDVIADEMVMLNRLKEQDVEVNNVDIAEGQNFFKPKNDIVVKSGDNDELTVSDIPF